MNNLKNILITIGIILILLLGTFIGGYQYAKKVYITNPATYTNVIVQRDTTWVRDSIAYPKPVYIKDTITIPQNIDTSVIINEYFKEKYYYFPYTFGNISFTVTQNSLFDFKPSIFTTNTTTYIKPLYMFGVGGSVGFITEKPFISVDGLYVKNNNTFSLSITYPIGFMFGYKYMFIKYK